MPGTGGTVDRADLAALAGDGDGDGDARGLRRDGGSSSVGDRGPEASEDTTTPGTSEGATAFGTSEAPEAPGVPEGPTVPGASEEFTVPGASEEFTVPAASEGPTVPGASEPDVPGPSEEPEDPQDPAGSFTEELAIPPLADSYVDESGTRVFKLTAQEGSMSFAPGEETATWGFNGDFLGPTLRAERGERVAVEVTNELDEATSVHWHGMHLPPEMDGGPHQEVEAGETWRPTWLIDQPAATLWYHPHPHGKTEEHVYRGLAGMFILDDDTADAAGLPSEYGVDDIPVIVQDKELTEDNQFTLDSPVPSGVMGHTIMVNGTVGAVQEVTSERVRLRVLNASTLRSYNFGFDDDRSFQVVATDGGLLEAPHETNRIQLTPAERAEIVVELKPGDDVMLRSYPQDLGAIADPEGYGARDTLDVLRLQAAEELAPSAEIAQDLSDYGHLDEADATVTRRFVLENLKINGERMDMARIDDVVTVGTTEIWEVTNLDPIPHNFHIHDVQFEVLSINGEAPPPELAGRKDTIYTEPGGTVRLIMRFEHYADSDTPYMYHCHVLRHEDFGLMGQFVVVEPGTEPPTTIPEEGHGHGGGHDEEAHEHEMAAAGAG